MLLKFNLAKNSPYTVLSFVTDVIQKSQPYMKGQSRDSESCFKCCAICVMRSMLSRSPESLTSDVVPTLYICTSFEKDCMLFCLVVILTRCTFNCLNKVYIYHIHKVISLWIIKQVSYPTGNCLVADLFKEIYKTDLYLKIIQIQSSFLQILSSAFIFICVCYKNLLPSQIICLCWLFYHLMCNISSFFFNGMWYDHDSLMSC